MVRSSTTWLLYAAFGCMAFLLNGLGAVLPSLQHELRVSRSQVAFYPSLFAVGLVLVGLLGGSVVARVGRTRSLRFAVACILGGGLLLSAGGYTPTLVGVTVAGLGAALLIQIVPAVLAALHPRESTAAIGEANGLASAASVAAPLAVAVSISAGLGWRPGYLVLPLATLAATLYAVWRSRLPTSPGAGAALDAERQALPGLWADLILAVSVEFCMVFWAASAFADWHRAAPALAAASASVFLVGMAVVRSLAVPVTRRVADSRLLILGCSAVAATGFAGFWFGPSMALAGAGLAVTGLGVALLYPVTLSRVINAWPHAPDRASARAALGSGLAIGIAPFILGRLSDSIGLRAAYLVVPVLVATLAVHAGTSAKPRATTIST